MSKQIKTKGQSSEKKQTATHPVEKKAVPLRLNTLRIIIFVFSIVLYVQTIGYDFTLDDTLMITSNTLTKEGISGIADIFTNDAFAGFFGSEKDLVAGGRYRPLTHAMFAVEYEFFGASPLVGHAMNILLYAFLGLIVFNTLTYCFKHIPTSKEWVKYIPLTATLLFIAHPLHTEVVANIKGRDEIISMGGSMLALLYSLKYIDHKHFKYLVFSFISLLVGIFSKENAITFLAVIPLSLYFFTSARKKDYAMTLIPLLLASVIFIIARYNALGFFMSNTIQTEILNNPFINSPKSDEIATVIFTWLLYVKLLFVPHPLTHDYYPWHLNILNFSSPGVLIALTVVIALLVTAILLFKRRHIVSFGILFFVITFSIQSNLLFNIGTFMNERFMFVALLGFCLILANYLSKHGLRLVKRPEYLLIVILLLYSAKTISRSQAWKNNFSLFTTDVKTSENSAKCNTSAAECILDEAEKITEPAKAKEMYTEAYTYLLHAQKLHPTYYGAYDLAGKAAFHLNDFRASFINYKMCLTINPDAPVPVDNIYLVSIAASQGGRHFEAIDMLLWLTDFAPDSLHYKLELAGLYEKTGNIKAGVDTLQSVIAQDPGNAKAWAKLGEIYGKHFNNLSMSESYLKTAWELNPNDFSVNENLGIVYGMQKQFQLSVDFFNRALSIDSTQARLYQNIANTYAMMGQKELAKQYADKGNSLDQK